MINFIKMNFRHIVLAAGISLLFFACSKDKSYEPDQDHPALKDSSFQPVSAGSTWHYLDTLQGDFTLTSTERDTIMDGVNYHIFQSKPDTATTTTSIYFGKQQTSYFGRGLVSQLQDINLLYLKDTTVNSTWSQTIQVAVPVLGSVTATITSQLVAVNTTRTVEGKSYQNVSQVTFKIGIQNPLPITYAQGSWYAARGVGLIEMQAQAQGSTVGNLYLTDYKIK